MSTENIIGGTYGELTVLKKIPRPDTEKYKTWNTQNWVECRCSCGKIVQLPVYGVTKGLIKSCGHYRSEKAAETLEKVRVDHPTPTAVNITYENRTMNISEWAEETGIPRSTIMYRLNKDMPLDEVFRKEDKNEQQ